MGLIATYAAPPPRKPGLRVQAGHMRADESCPEEVRRTVMGAAHPCSVIRTPRAGQPDKQHLRNNPAGPCSG